MTDKLPILLVAALHNEMKPVAARLSKRHRFTTLVTGPDGERMVAKLTPVLDATKPARIILIGFCGALALPLAAGDIIVPTHLIRISNGLDTLKDEVIILRDGPPVIAERNTPRDEKTTLLSNDWVITEPEWKIDAGKLHRAAAVDMESYDVALLAAQRGIPLTVIRAVSDPVEFKLPFDVGQWVNDDGKPRISAVMRALARKPSLLPTLLKLQAHTKTAASNLAAAVERMFR